MNKEEPMPKPRMNKEILRTKLKKNIVMKKIIMPKKFM